MQCLVDNNFNTLTNFTSSRLHPSPSHYFDIDNTQPLPPSPPHEIASQGAPKSYLNFSPPGRPGVRFEPDREVNPENLGSRRAHMEAFFKHMGRGSKEQLDKGREVAVLYMCWFLHAKKRLPKIGVVYFELAVDFTIWYNNCEFRLIADFLYANNVQSRTFARLGNQNPFGHGALSHPRSRTWPGVSPRCTPPI